MVTMVEIAKSLGVSAQTVSAVVNNKPGISEETRKRVRREILRLDFQPNQQAQTLRAGRSKTICAVIHSITNPYFPELMKGVEDVAREEGYALYLCNSEADEQTILDYISMVRAHRASGLIYCPVGRIDPDSVEIDRLNQLKRDGVSVVLFAKDVPGFGFAEGQLETTVATRQAAEYLAGLGHRRVAITTPPASTNAWTRVDEFVAAFAAVGISVPAELIIPGDFSIEAGGAAAATIMAMADRPTAVIAANDLAAFGLISAFEQAGVRVPADISVVGYDDIPFARIYRPALTTIAQPIYQIGRAAGCRAIFPDMATDPAAPRLEARFVIRESTTKAKIKPSA